MPFTAIITCIHSALDDAELLLNNANKRTLKALRANLKNLIIFVLCARNLKNNASFGPFLVQFERIVRRKAAELNMVVASHIGSVESVDRSFFCLWYKEIPESLEEEIDKWYVTMLDCDCTQQSTPLMTNEQVLETISSILELLVDYQSMEFYPSYALLLEAIKPLADQMLFLKSFICFVTRSNEAKEDLFVHAEAIAISAAYLIFRCRNIYFDEESWELKQAEISTLVQKMKPIDPQVYHIYTQALSSSKLSRRFLDVGAFVTMKNYLDSLISNLWDVLRLDIYHSVFMKDQLDELEGRLLSLRAILKISPLTKFDLKIQGEIADLVCDAGITVCSLYQTQMEVDIGLEKLLKTFKDLLAEIGDSADPPNPICNISRASAYGFVDFILEKLEELPRNEAESTTKSHVQVIHGELAFIRSFLGKVGKLCDEQTEIQTLWDRLLEVAYKVESTVIHHLVVGPSLDSFSSLCDFIMKDISNIKADALKLEVKEVRIGTYTDMPSGTTPLTPNAVIGFQEEETNIFSRLQRGSQHLRIIVIIGMPGIGKTTLATKVFNHPSLSYHFSACAWCPISQVLDKKKVLLDLLKQINPNISHEIDEHGLADELRRCLKRRRYLIFLDDMWNTEAWNSLKDSFPDDMMGSRIVLTSRSYDVAPCDLLDQEPLFLSPLSMEESVELAQSKLFPGKGNLGSSALRDLGMQIAEKCKGLPLAIITLSGVLANIEVEGWKKIMDGFSFVSSADYCRYTLDLSYKHLPDYLKPCFLYFGSFPEDQEVPVRRLLRLWIAEGFVRKSEMKSLEDIADGYLKILISRSLIIAAKTRTDGGVKTCRIHDLLHDYCLRKAKAEHFFHFLRGYNDLSSFNEPKSLQRLCIDSEPEDLRESMFFCPRARSLLMSCSQQSERRVYGGEPLMLHFFKLLKVLDLEQISVGYMFPSEIQKLVLLAFLAVRGEDLSIPSWIANLSKLETFIITQRHSLLLPDSFWNMQNLKYVCIRGQVSGSGGLLPFESLDNSSVLFELDKFSGGMVQWGSMEKQLRKFPNICRLKCRLVRYRGETGYPDKFVFPDFLSKLASLHMSSGLDFRVRFEFTSLTNLKRLTLSTFNLHWEIFSVIGNQLPSIEVLKLCELRFSEDEDTWEVKEGEFSKLRALHMSCLPLLLRLRDHEDHQFECLQRLVLSGCDTLEELPSCLTYIPTLEIIELYDCPQSVVNLAMEIEKVQKEEWGNSAMNITVRRTQ